MKLSQQVFAKISHDIANIICVLDNCMNLLDIENKDIVKSARILAITQSEKLIEYHRFISFVYTSASISDIAFLKVKRIMLDLISDYKNFKLDITSYNHPLSIRAVIGQILACFIHIITSKIDLDANISMNLILYDNQDKIDINIISEDSKVFRRLNIFNQEIIKDLEIDISNCEELYFIELMKISKLVLAKQIDESNNLLSYKIFKK